MNAVSAFLEKRKTLDTVHFPGLNNDTSNKHNNYINELTHHYAFSRPRFQH